MSRVTERDGIPSALEHLDEARATSANPSVVDQVHAVAHAVMAMVQMQDRQARALERIADRLDSWTYDPHAPESVVTRASDGPELRVRRW